MPRALEIRLLGPLEVLAGSSAAEVTGAKRLALLALLALRRGRVVGVDALIEALWGEELPAAPRNALQHHIARLRAALGHDSITATADGYALTDAAAVDALRFEELLGDARAALRDGDVRAAADAIEIALGLWRGPALHGLTETAWFSAEARRLEALRIDALEEQFEAALALGRHRELVSPLRAALERDPFRERLWGELMLALYRSGRQADALDTYQEARRVLAEELGLEPGPGLRHLQEAILAHDPAIAPVARAGPRGNLPAPSTSFVGREAVLARVVGLLREQRLVTLCGPPGVGKSRLALEAARVAGDETRGGVWRVDLARAGGPDDVERLLADALDARGPDPVASVAARLRPTDALVVLDACEHVREEAGRIAAILLAECPDVHVLATSRAVLRLPGEVRLQVEPLPLFDESADPLDAPAVQLFLARAQAARPGFALTADNAPLVAEIARRLDGLPLAIELAAARVNVLGLSELLSVVERRLALLQSGGAAEPERLGLQRLVEWSYDLLHADEKLLLQEVAVHRGGASLQSLVGIGERRGLDEAALPYLIGALVDKSIVSVSFAGDVARYDLLDTVRDYVVGVLAENERLGVVRMAHADYFAALADAARDELRGPAWRARTRQLALEHDNLWAALAYAEEASASETLVLLGTLGWYFSLADRVSEGRRFLERVAAGTAGSEGFPLDRHLELLAQLCYLATEELDAAAAIEAGEHGIALAGEAAAPWQLGLVQVALAHARAHAGDSEGAADLAEAALARLEGSGDAWSIAAAALLRANIAAAVMDVPTTAAMAALVRRHADAIAFDAFRVPALLLEGWVAERRDERKPAADAYGKAIEVGDRVGLADHAAFARARLGSLARRRGELELAAELLREASARAVAAEATLAAAQADVELAAVLTASGDDAGAERLYRRVVEWSNEPRAHHARESLFTALGGSPGAAAVLGLAELAGRRGEEAPVRQ